MLDAESDRTGRTRRLFPASIRILDPGTCLDHRYEIRRVLGVGGYAVVYLAFDRELRREVALKVLRADRMSPGSLARLRREAAVARDAASPRLVRIFDIGTSDAAVYLTLEVIEGESLRDRLKRGPLARRSGTAGGPALEGLQVLQSLGIVHRDIRPGNILLEPGGGVKLADFGLALRSNETRLTLSEGVLGTLDYVSPSRPSASLLPERDLYSLGVVLFEMFAGDCRIREERARRGARPAARPGPGRPQNPAEVPAWLGDGGGPLGEGPLAAISLRGRRPHGARPAERDAHPQVAAAGRSVSGAAVLLRSWRRLSGCGMTGAGRGSRI